MIMRAVIESRRTATGAPSWSFRELPHMCNPDNLAVKIADW